MLENLVNLVKEFSGDAIVNNPDVPNEHNDDVVAETTHAVAGGLQNELSSGGLDNVMSLFNSGGQGNISDNPVVGNMISNLSGTLQNKYGLGSSQASNVAGSMIPNVISNLIHRTNDPNNKSFDIQSIISSLTGGGAGGGTTSGGGGFDLGGLVSKFTGGGLDSNHDGKVGLDDIVSKFTGGGNSGAGTTSGGGGGGLMDMIRGFMK